MLTDMQKKWIAEFGFPNDEFDQVQAAAKDNKTIEMVKFDAKVTLKRKKRSESRRIFRRVKADISVWSGCDRGDFKRESRLCKILQTMIDKVMIKSSKVLANHQLDPNFKSSPDMFVNIRPYRSGDIGGLLEDLIYNNGQLKDNPKKHHVSVSAKDLSETLLFLKNFCDWKINGDYIPLKLVDDSAGIIERINDKFGQRKIARFFALVPTTNPNDGPPLKVQIVIVHYLGQTEDGKKCYASYPNTIESQIFWRKLARSGINKWQDMKVLPHGQSMHNMIIELWDIIASIDLSHKKALEEIKTFVNLDAKVTQDKFVRFMKPAYPKEVVLFAKRINQKIFLNQNQREIVDFYQIIEFAQGQCIWSSIEEEKAINFVLRSLLLDSVLEIVAAQVHTQIGIELLN